MAQTVNNSKWSRTVPPTLTPIARLSVSIGTPLVVGHTESGLREVIPITGGIVTGSLLAGKVLPGGADWCLTRPDGVAEVWARYTLALDGGHLVSVINAGLAHPQADGSYTGHTVPQFETGASELSWLRNSIFVGTLVAQASGRAVDVAFYRVD